MHTVVIVIGTFKYRCKVAAQLIPDIKQEIEDRFMISKHSIDSITL